MDDAERKSALRKAYGQATQDLRDKHRDEFNQQYAERAAEAGVEWNPRLSPEEKAAAEFDALLAEFPQLKERLTQA